MRVETVLADRILMIEDDESLSAMVCEYLENAGFELSSKATGASGLELGADDYLPKPFNPRELLARLRAILRSAGPRAANSRALRFGRLEVDRDARIVRVDGEECTLTSHQFDLVCALADNPGRVMSRDALMRHVRGQSLDAFDRSIDVHISRIRAAIEDDPKKPRRVITIRDAGYVWATQQDDETDRR